MLVYEALWKIAIQYKSTNIYVMFSLRRKRVDGISIERLLFTRKGPFEQLSINKTMKNEYSCINCHGIYNLITTIRHPATKKETWTLIACLKSETGRSQIRVSFDFLSALSRQASTWKLTLYFHPAISWLLIALSKVPLFYLCQRFPPNRRIF